VESCLYFSQVFFDKRTCLFGGWKGTNFIPALLTSVARLIVILYCLAAGHLYCLAAGGDFP